MLFTVEEAGSLLGPGLGVEGGRDQGDVNVQIVTVLDGTHHWWQLLELVLEIGQPLLAHHKVVLHGNGQTVPNHEGLEGPLGLREGAGGRLVWHPRREALVV